MDLKIKDCRSCPFVLKDETFGFYGCSLSNEITNMYINQGSMPQLGIHELCTIKNEQVIITIQND